MPYNVFTNIAGYLPDMEDVWEYDTLEEAWKAIADDFEDRVNSRCDESYAYGQMVAGRAAIARATELNLVGEVHVMNPDNSNENLVYNVTKD